MNWQRPDPYRLAMDFQESLERATREAIRDELAREGTVQETPLSKRDRERRTRFDAARDWLLSQHPPVKPTDDNIAEYLNVTPRTIRNWRRDGSIS